MPSKFITVFLLYLLLLSPGLHACMHKLLQWYVIICFMWTNFHSFSPQLRFLEHRIFCAFTKSVSLRLRHNSCFFWSINYLVLCPAWPNRRGDHQFVRDSLWKSKQVLDSVLVHLFGIAIGANLVRQADRIVQGQRVGWDVLCFCTHFLTLLIIPAEEKCLANIGIITHQPECNSLWAQPIWFCDATEVFISVLKCTKKCLDSTYVLCSNYIQCLYYHKN